MIVTNSIILAATDQVSCDLAGEAAILNLANGVYYGLDPVGAYIWGLLKEPRKVGELRDAVMNQYDVDAEQCERDLLSLLGDLEKNGLIQVDNGTIA